jgi:hypothetical protein
MESKKIILIDRLKKGCKQGFLAIWMDELANNKKTSVLSNIAGCLGWAVTPNLLFRQGDNPFPGAQCPDVCFKLTSGLGC